MPGVSCDPPLGFGGWDLGTWGFGGGTWGQPFRFWGTWGLGVGLGDNPLGFGGWDKGTWGLGVGLGDNYLSFWGWEKGSWGVGVGLGDNPLGFGGWDKGTSGLGVGSAGAKRLEVWDLGTILYVFYKGIWGLGAWEQPFRFWGAGTRTGKRPKHIYWMLQQYYIIQYKIHIYMFSLIYQYTYIYLVFPKRLTYKYKFKFIFIVYTYIRVKNLVRTNEGMANATRWLAFFTCIGPEQPMPSSARYLCTSQSQMRLDVTNITTENNTSSRNHFCVGARFIVNLESTGTSFDWSSLCEPVNIKLRMMHSCLSNDIATKREVLSVRANTIACIWVLQIDELPVKTGNIRVRVCKFTMLKILFISRHAQIVLYQIFLGGLFQSHSRLIHATPGSALCAFHLGARTSLGNEVTLYSRLLQKIHWVHPKNVQGFLTDSSSDPKTPTQNYSSSYISRLLLGNLPFRAVQRTCGLWNASWPDLQRPWPIGIVGFLNTLIIPA